MVIPDFRQIAPPVTQNQQVIMGPTVHLATQRVIGIQLFLILILVEEVVPIITTQPAQIVIQAGTIPLPIAGSAMIATTRGVRA